MRFLIPVLSACLLLNAQAHALDPPTGRVILTVTGDIATTNVGNEARFDREMLLALPQHETVTRTPWHDGVVRFTGPLGRDLMATIGARGDNLRVTALNDYAADIPVADLREHDVILAMNMDGVPMSVRDQGPLFVIYPFDDSPQLLNEEVLMRSVWQVHRIDVIGD
jgi:hypothetical protein